MTEIPVFSKDGQIDYMLVLPEDVEYVSGRTSKSKHLYYKGVGTTYLGHTSLSPGVYTNCGKASVFYYGYHVKNSNWFNKFGIFQDRFQPYFSDFAGGCGVKELQIINNSSSFELSAVKVVDAVKHDEINNQFYFVLDYISPRMSYTSNPISLISLLDYMVTYGWNFPWDKASIKDINNFGYVTDVADMFKSEDVAHSFGTIYSVIYSLYKTNIEGYKQLISKVNFSGDSISDLPFLTLLFLRLFKKDIYLRENIKSKNQLYVHLVGNVLLRGKNCAGVENLNEANRVMIEYLDNFKKDLSKEEISILDIY